MPKTTKPRVYAEPRLRSHSRDLDSICRRIADGVTLAEIASQEGISPGTLSEWIEVNPERSARARAARILAARVWDDRAEAVLRDASDLFELAKAKELAHHYRWRASKIAPRDYGDRTVLAGDPAAPLPIASINMSPEEFRRIAVEVAAKI